MRVIGKRTNDINFALVEEKRPPLYRSMKYWGKKPHNIWRDYIENYTPKDGLYLDPFAGSALSAFEAIKIGRKAIAFDLNPLTTFFIEVLSSDFNLTAFRNAGESIIEKIEADNLYTKHYITKCDRCGKDATIVNFKWKKYIYS